MNTPTISERVQEQFGNINALCGLTYMQKSINDFLLSTVSSELEDLRKEVEGMKAPCRASGKESSSALNIVLSKILQKIDEKLLEIKKQIWLSSSNSDTITGLDSQGGSAFHSTKCTPTGGWISQKKTHCGAMLIQIFVDVCTVVIAAKEQRYENNDHQNKTS